MSSDNGIYILVTPIAGRSDSFEYRVRELMAVENYTYKYCDIHGMDGYDADCPTCKCEVSPDPDVYIKNAREMWKNLPVFTNKEDAFNEAHRIYQNLIKIDECFLLEYGISTIEIPRPFDEKKILTGRFQRLKQLHPDLLEIRFNGGELDLMFPNDANDPSGGKHPWSKTEFKSDSESYKLIEEIAKFLIE